MPSMLCVTDYNHKICSKNHKLCTVKMNYQSPQKMAKNKIFFFRRSIRTTQKTNVQFKRAQGSQDLLGNVEKRTFDYTAGWLQGGSLASHYGKKIFLRSLSCTQSTVIKVPIKILAIFPLESSSIISISYLILTTYPQKQARKTKNMKKIVNFDYKKLEKPQIQSSTFLTCLITNLIITAKSCGSSFFTRDNGAGLFSTIIQNKFQTCIVHCCIVFQCIDFLVLNF